MNSVAALASAMDYGPAPGVLWNAQPHPPTALGGKLVAGALLECLSIRHESCGQKYVPIATTDST